MYICIGVFINVCIYIYRERERIKKTQLFDCALSFLRRLAKTSQTSEKDIGCAE